MKVLISYIRDKVVQVVSAYSDMETLCCLEIVDKAGKDEMEIPSYLEKQFAKSTKDDIIDVLMEVQYRTSMKFHIVEKDPEPIQERIVSELRTIIHERKLNAKDLCKLIGMQESNFSKILNGKTSPSIAILNKLCTVLGVSLSLTKNYQPLTDEDVDDDDFDFMDDPEMRESHFNPYASNQSRRDDY